MNRVLLLFLFMSVAACCVRAEPQDDRIANIRSAFLALPRPISYVAKIEKEDYSHFTSFQIKNETASFANKYSLSDKIFALWPFLDEPKYEAEASIVLLASIGRRFINAVDLTFRSADHPGNWEEYRDHVLWECKTECREALNKPEWWYPHPELFNLEQVMVESKTNAAVRASYIAQMKAALADPKIRSGNPLEVKQIFSILGRLKAYDATEILLDYVFYDWRTGADFRIQTRENAMEARFPEGTLNVISLLSSFGTNSMNQVLQRFASATEEEQSIEVGGGGLPFVAILYFFRQGIKEADAMQLIKGYISAHAELNERQRKVLDNLVTVIREKKFRADFMRGTDWAAPSPANAVSVTNHR